jgi:hypothetical protein
MAGSTVGGFGVDLYGVPAGEAGYVSAVLDARLTDAESKLKILRDKLCNVDFNDQARALNHFCCAPLLDHLMQCCYPSDTEPFLKRFDRLLLLNYNLITGVDFVGEDRAVAAEDIRMLKRLRLAARFRGGGLRARGGWVRYASFWGGVNLSLPFFADRASGKHQVGFFPSLATLLGAGSFEAGGTKYATYLAGGTRLGTKYAHSMGSTTAGSECGSDLPSGTSALGGGGAARRARGGGTERRRHESHDDRIWTKDPLLDQKKYGLRNVDIFFIRCIFLPCQADFV